MFLDHHKEVPIVVVVKEGEPIEKDVVHLSMPPTFKAKCYQTMWTLGNHLHVSSVEEHLTTCDNGVTSIFEQECVLGPKTRFCKTRIFRMGSRNIKVELWGTKSCFVV